jgi:hypothetical protein
MPQHEADHGRQPTRPKRDGPRDKKEGRFWRVPRPNRSRGKPALTYCDVISRISAKPRTRATTPTTSVQPLDHARSRATTKTMPIPGSRQKHERRQTRASIERIHRKSFDLDALTRQVLVDQSRSWGPRVVARSLDRGSTLVVCFVRVGVTVTRRSILWTASVTPSSPIGAPQFFSGATSILV